MCSRRNGNPGPQRPTIVVAIDAQLLRHECTAAASGVTLAKEEGDLDAADPRQVDATQVPECLDM